MHLVAAATIVEIALPLSHLLIVSAVVAIAVADSHHLLSSVKRHVELSGSHAAAFTQHTTDHQSLAES